MRSVRVGKAGAAPRAMGSLELLARTGPEAAVVRGEAVPVPGRMKAPRETPGKLRQGGNTGKALERPGEAMEPGSSP